MNSLHVGVNRIYPPTLNTRQKLGYSRKFNQHFETNGTHLYYRPAVPHQANPRTNLEIIRPADRDLKIKEV